MADVVKHKYFGRVFKFKNVLCKVIKTSENSLQFKWLGEKPHEHRYANGTNTLTYAYIKEHNLFKYYSVYAKLADKL